MRRAGNNPAAVMTSLHHESEAGFCTAVIDCARTFGWLVHHDRPARTAHGWRTAIEGDAGFPDCLFLGYGRLIVAELKVGRNLPTQSQSAWLWHFGQLSETFWHVECHLWKPENWDEIEACFKRRGGPRCLP